MTMPASSANESLLDVLQLPRVPHRIYKNPPLALVVCQIRFSHVLNMFKPDFVASFQEAIKDEYPLLGGNDAFSLEMQIEYSNELGAPQIRTERTPQYMFRDRQDNWTVVLTKDFVSVETRRYQAFDDFLERLRRVLDALVIYVKPTVITRIGLRYINEFKFVGDLQSWSSVLRGELLGLLTIPNIAKYANVAVQEVRLNLPDQQGLTIRHGPFPGGTTVLPRQGRKVEEGPFYLLDFDLFKEFSASDSSDMDAADMCNYIQDYNQTVFQLFHWLVTERYVSTLEVVESNVDEPTR